MIKQASSQFELIQHQREASDPRFSVFVTASAGSGKTHVLTQRVMRLLLGGSSPSKLLCLTFTKSSAATLTNRIFSRLSAWVKMDQEQLISELIALSGQTPGVDLIVRARSLFAVVLDTPGGLNVQTIHGFCAGLLRRFSRETGLMWEGNVVGEQAAEIIAKRAKDCLLVQAWDNPRSRDGQAVNSVVRAIGKRGLNRALNTLLRDRIWFFDLLREYGNLAGLSVAMKKAVLSSANDTTESLCAEILNSPFADRINISELIHRLLIGSANDALQAGRFLAAFDDDLLDLQEKSKNLISIFLNNKGKPRRQVGISKAIHRDFPQLASAAHEEANRLINLCDRQKALAALELTESIIYLGNSVVNEYQRLKGNEGVLDFTDIVAHASHLVSNSELSSWVQYQIDQEIDHVLLDEAQDLSTKQWDIICQITAEFFSGETARETHRTVFAVGDPKQSIYSFQGACPQEFYQRECLFRRLAQYAGQEFRSSSFQYSFRSAPNILGAVDAVFSSLSGRIGVVQSRWMQHKSVRIGAGGKVEIWHPKKNRLHGKTGLTTHMNPASAKAQDIAVMVANAIEEMLSDKAALQSTWEPIRPGDIMVLVRKRGLFTDILNRELKQRNICVAGSDRLKLFQHIVVLDLLALGEVMLLPENDLALAKVLKSPLVGFSDHELMLLATSRASNETLYAALTACNDLQAACDACETLKVWREWARRMTAFEFYARVLGQAGRRKAFFLRFGEEVVDVLDEFLSCVLANECANGPSLTAFVTSASGTDLEVKRAFGEASDEVRVMTVHGAKGLEAPVVFVVDAYGDPLHSAHDPAFLPVPANLSCDEVHKAKLMLWNMGQSRSPVIMQEALKLSKAAAMAEYYRLLYVAMTRAADRLIIAGYHFGLGVHADNWFSCVSNSLGKQVNSGKNEYSCYPVSDFARDSAHISVKISAV